MVFYSTICCCNYLCLKLKITSQTNINSTINVVKNHQKQQKFKLILVEFCCFFPPFRSYSGASHFSVTISHILYLWWLRHIYPLLKWPELTSYLVDLMACWITYIHHYIQIPDVFHFLYFPLSFILYIYFLSLHTILSVISTHLTESEYLHTYLIPFTYFSCYSYYNRFMLHCDNTVVSMHPTEITFTYNILQKADRLICVDVFMSPPDMPISIFPTSRISISQEAPKSHTKLFL